MKAIILRHPLLVVALVLAVTASFAVPASRISIDPSVEGMILEDDPDLLFYQRFVEQFGSDEIVAIRIRAPRLFERETLESIDRLSTAVGEIRVDDGTGRSLAVVDRVVSLTRVDRIESTTDGNGDPMLDVGPLVARYPDSPEEAARLRERATSDSLYVENFLSAPRTEDPDEPLSTLILARVLIRPDDLVYRTTVTDRVKEILAEESERNPSLEGAFRLAGVPILKSEIGRETEQETARVQVAIWGVILVALVAMFPVRLPALFVLAAIVCAAIWTVGFMVLCGGRINILSAVILPLVRIIAMMTAIHILSGYYTLARSSRSPSELVGATLDRVTLPCFLATFTTAVGFLALTSSDIVAVRELGLFTGFGVMAVWVITNSMIPALLVRIEAPPAERRSLIASRRMDELLEALGGAVIRFRVPVLAVSIVAVGVCLVGVTRLKVSTDLLDYFPPEHPLRLSYEAIADEIGPTHPLDITIRTAPGAALDSSFLSRVQGLEDWLVEQPEVELVTSLVDYVRRLNREFHGGDPARFRIPDSAEQTAGLLFMLETGSSTDPISPFLQPSWEAPEVLRLSVRIRTLDTDEILALIGRIERHLAADFGARPEVDPPAPPAPLVRGEAATRVTGVVALYANMATAVVDGQVRSLAIAFCVIWLTVSVVVRSIRVASLAMLPNILPTLAVLGAMGFSGVSLNIGTAMIAAVTLGIAVDDTIHFLLGFERIRSGGLDPEAAVRHTMREVGRPMALTTAIVTAGFAASSMIASFPPVTQFNLFSGLALALALIADLTLLPALLVSFPPRGQTGTPERLLDPDRPGA